MILKNEKRLNRSDSLNFVIIRIKAVFNSTVQQTRNFLTFTFLFLNVQAKHWLC